MLIIYDIDTKQIISIGGCRPNGRKLSEAEKHPELVDGILEGQAIFRVLDEEKMDEIWATKDSGGTLELVFDGNTPVDIKCTMPAL